MPKSVAGQFLGQYGYESSKYVKESEVIRTDLDRMSWTSTGASGRVRAETLGWFLDKMDGFKFHPTPSVQRAAKKFIDTFTEPYEKTQRLINEEQEQAPELTASDFMDAVQGQEQAKRLVVIACGGRSPTPGGDPRRGALHRELFPGLPHGRRGHGRRHDGPQCQARTHLAQ
ncbi:hypothetical protein ACR6C2_16905 [Streptomyces sp. INA 01156]